MKLEATQMNSTEKGTSVAFDNETSSETSETDCCMVQGQFDLQSNIEWLRGNDSSSLEDSSRKNKSQLDLLLCRDMQPGNCRFTVDLYIAA